MLGNRNVRSVLGLLLTFVIGTAYLVGSVLEIPLTGGRAEVTVELEGTGGLFESSPVTYRGVRVGTVEEIRIAGDAGGAVATITLAEDAKVPQDSRAVVRSLSPVGEQYLDFQPVGSQGPYLADGDRVAAESTELPASLAAAAGKVESLLDAVDEQDLHTVLHELDAALSGGDDDLERLLVSSERLVTSLDDAWPETRRLLRNGRDVGRLFAHHREDLARFSRDAAVLARWLRGFDPAFRRILRRAPRDFVAVGRLVADLSTLLPPFLDALVGLTDILHEREPHLREFTRTLPFGVRRFASAFSDGWLNVDLNLAGQRQCHYAGIEPHDPQSDDRRPLDADGHCTLDDAVWRGAEHAPPPLDR